jgi:CheY-like chemotaxis protein
MLILNVDDDSDDREIFCDAVNTVDPQISCVQVESGISALQLLDKSDTLPDYMFIDMNMPKMTGLECVRKIRCIPRFLGIRIVMYSTGITPNDQNHLSEMQIECLAKQSRFSDLVSELRNLLLDKIQVLAK